jgi:hypothetical protein
MPPLVIPNTAQVILHWFQGAAFASNVLGAIRPGTTAIDQGVAESIGAAIKSGLTSSGLLPLLAADVSLANVGVRDTSSAGQPEYQDSGGLITGTAADEALPRQTALVVSCRTDRAGASYRGRVYLSGFTEISNGPGGQASGAAQTASVAFVQACSDAMDAAGLSFAVLSRPRLAFTIPAVEIAAKAGFATAITSLEMRNSMWDTQRRRATPGGGSTFLSSRTFVQLRKNGQERGARSS